MKNPYFFKVIFTLCVLLCTSPSWSQYQMEKLNRGVLAIRTGTNNFVSWRWLGNEDDIAFNLYRNGAKVNANPLTVTNYTDNGAASTAQYYVRSVVGGVEQPQSETVGVWGQNYLEIPLQIPAGGTTPSGENYTYSANDCSVGDVDADGIQEIFVKWDPSNAKDNSQSGYTGNVYIDCYKLNGTRLWRIDLGRNIRAGAHYTQFMVYDFDGDGRAEMACKTADATRDAAGTVIGNSNADYRSSAGYVLSGPEFLTMFNGGTGRIMQTVGYIPARGTVSSWGDNYGNRVDRFLAGVAYLDGQRPSLISCRGYYTRTVLVAWDWRNGAFVRRWTFDSNIAGSQYAGQGDHSLSIADVDSDNKQEIIYGAMVIDDNGSVLYSTGHGHGDALHVSDFDPSIPGLEVFNIQERNDSEDCYLYSPSQKRVLWSKGTTGGEGPGRGVAANITDDFPGAECWTAGGQVSGSPFQVNGNSMGRSGPSSTNFLIYWDGDLARELNNGTTIDKYPSGRLLTPSGCASNNGSKSNPGLVGDILGDWREELVVRSSGNNFIRIYSTTTPSPHKVRTLLHDAQYRVALAWQNTAYNQPPHQSFFLGNGVALPPKPNITIIGDNTPGNVAPTVSVTAPANNASYTAPANITITANAADSDGTVSNVQFYNGSTLLGSDATSPYSFSWTNVAAGTYTLTARATDNLGAVTSSAAVTVIVSAPPAGFTLQAEIACTADGILSEATNAGFNGAGYLNLDNVAGSAASWVINSNTNQTVSLNVRYANGSANNRNMSISVNGAIQVSNASFISTGGWTTWNVLTVSLNLSAGRNTLQMISLMAEGAPNIDELGFSPTTISAASCTLTNIAPTVSIASPANNANFTAPATITITANAADTDGTVSNVQFYNGSTLLGSDATSPYTFTWNNVAAGTYVITAGATDNSGAVTSSAAITVTVTAACTPTVIVPYIQIDGGAWTETSTAGANIGSQIILGPQPTTGGSWTWVGPNGFGATTREITLNNILGAHAGNYVATFTNEGGCESTHTFTLTVNQAPTISITSPANNASYTAAVGITIEATASDADGTVSNVQFYQGATLLGSDATSPYSFTWSNVAAGTYVLTARATDNSGAVTTSTAITVVVSPANVAPTVSITSPVNNASFTAPTNISIEATASDEDGTVSGVQFYQGATLLGSDATSPYSFTWSNVAAGTYVLTARATDNSGAVTTSTAITVEASPANVAPTVSITSPVNNASFTVPTNITIEASASDEDGTVSGVQFYQGATLLGSDATSPYSFTWSNVAAGTYVLTARATDNSGAVTTSTAITVVVDPANVAPTVSITSPVNNASFTAPTNITIEASASDEDGTVSSVQFYHGATLLGSDAASPYSFIWSNVAAGTYTLTARATDNSGAVTTSAAITVVVNPHVDLPPTVSITSPANNANFIAPASITINATVFDASSIVSNVQFYNGAILLGSDDTSPYSFTWTNVAAGTYALTARATNNTGASANSSVIIVHVSAPPQGLTIQAETACSADGVMNETINAGFNGSAYVNLSNMAGATVSFELNSASVQTVDLGVRFANGTANTKNMSILVNGVSQVASVDFASTGAWTTWTTVTTSISLASGNNLLQLVSLTSDGGPNLDEITFSSSDISTVNCSNRLPTIHISAPANNATYIAPATVSITATAADADGTISKVDFFNGTTLLGTDLAAPYSFTWNNVVAGTYTITAMATDNEGGEAVSSIVSISVSGNQASVITITSPTNNGTVNGSTVTISGTASDPDGDVTIVDYYSGTTHIGSSTGSPFSFNWNAGDGTHVITILVTDSNGGVTSSSVTVTVNTSTTGIVSGSGHGIFKNIYPNPSSEFFLLESDQKIKHLRILNMYGVEVGEMHNIDSGKKVEIGSDLNSGTYMLMVEYASHKIEVAKLVKLK